VIITDVTQSLSVAAQNELFELLLISSIAHKAKVIDFVFIFRAFQLEWHKLP
jgi:hypothetical protein